MKKIYNYLNETVKKEKYILIFIIIIFIIGLISGSLFVEFISKDDKKLIINQVALFFNNIKKLDSSVYGFLCFKDNIISNIIQILSIFMLGISMVGIFVVIVQIFAKGFILGTTLSAIFLKYKIKGIIAAILYVFPFQVLIIMVYIFLSFFAVNASIKFLKALLKKDSLNFKTFLGRYVMAFFISTILICILVFLDSYVNPYLLKLFTYLL